VITEMIQNSMQLFENALTYLKDNYKSYHFFVERDIVWTLQLYMIKEVETQQLPFKIYDNHKFVKGKQADLVILNKDQSIDTLVEMKYEPDHMRANVDIFAGKFPRVYWNSKRDGGVEPDIVQVRSFVEQGFASLGFSIFIDEGSHFFRKTAPEGSMWVNWGQSPYSNKIISVLISKFTSL